MVDEVELDGQAWNDTTHMEPVISDYVEYIVDSGCRAGCRADCRAGRGVGGGAGCGVDCGVFFNRRILLHGKNSQKRDNMKKKDNKTTKNLTYVHK